MAIFITVCGLASVCVGAFLLLGVVDPLVWPSAAILILGGVGLLGMGSLIDLSRRRTRVLEAAADKDRDR